MGGRFCRGGCVGAVGYCGLVCGVEGRVGEEFCRFLDRD